MYSVDKAAFEYFSELGVPFSLVKFTGTTKVGKIRYEKLSAPEDLQRFQKIIFWGDFQQNPIWGWSGFAPRYAAENGGTREAGFSRWREMCLLENYEFKPSQKVYSIGTCFLGASNFLQKRGGASGYRDLLSRFHALAPRDVASFAELHRLGLSNVIQGFDCAALLRHDTKPGKNERHFGYAFGRTLNPQEAKAVVAAVEKATGCRGIQIDWLLKSYALKNCDYKYKKALGVINDAKFVITDIYHLSVNSMNLDSDIILVGREDEHSFGTCADYKKEVLMKMVGLENRYIKIPEGVGDCREYVVQEFMKLTHSRERIAASGFDMIAQSYRATLRQLLSD